MSKMITIETDVKIYSSAAVEDNTYAKYPFRIDIPINRCTEEHIPDIYLESGKSDLIYEICETRSGFVRVYVSKNNFGNITIPVIRLTKEVTV